MCHLDGSYGVSLYDVSVHVRHVVLHHVLVQSVEGVDRPAQQASVAGEEWGSGKGRAEMEGPCIYPVTLDTYIQLCCPVFISCEGV